MVGRGYQSDADAQQRQAAKAPVKVLVLQSHRLPPPAPWIERCMDSVARWAKAQGYGYRRLDDALFDPVAELPSARRATQPVVASDLARLLWLERLLKTEAERVLWLDADVLALPEAEGMQLPAGHGVGRQLWIQRERAGTDSVLRHRTQVHNAALCFDRGDPLLPFYRRTAATLLDQHVPGPVAPQFIGPKLLTALHSIARLQVMEDAAMLPPLVAVDLLKGDGAALTLYRAQCQRAPCLLNLCSSLAAEHSALGVCVPQLVDRLLEGGSALLAPTSSQLSP